MNWTANFKGRHKVSYELTLLRLFLITEMQALKAMIFTTVKMYGGIHIPVAI